MIVQKDSKYSFCLKSKNNFIDVFVPDEEKYKKLLFRDDFIDVNTVKIYTLRKTNFFFFEIMEII